MTTAIDIVVGGKILVVFPDLSDSDFTIASDAVDSHSSINTASTTIESDGTFGRRIVIAGGTMAAGADRALRINKITNPAARNTGTYTVRTLDSGNNVYEEKTDVAESTITAATMTAATVVVNATLTRAPTPFHAMCAPLDAQTPDRS